MIFSKCAGNVYAVLAIKQSASESERSQTEWLAELDKLKHVLFSRKAGRIERCNCRRRETAGLQDARKLNREVACRTVWICGETSKPFIHIACFVIFCVYIHTYICVHMCTNNTLKFKLYLYQNEKKNACQFFSTETPTNVTEMSKQHF